MSFRILEARILCIVVASSLLLTSTSAYAIPSVAVAETRTGVSAFRTVSLEVKVVFVGISESDIDTTYMSWNENLPAKINNEVLIGGRDLSVEFDVRYRFAFTDTSFKSKLTSYLNSIAETVQLENPAFGYYKLVRNEWQWTWMKVRSTQYDANKVEQWLKENSGEFGGMLESGWTLILMYLPELPSATYKTMKEYWKQDLTKSTTNVQPHYYKVTLEDRDLGYRLRYREFATAWGNHERLWFLDLSAGPSWWDWSNTFPLQVAIEDQEILLGSTYGKTWLTEYLADYAWGAVQNFAVPSAVYYPTYTAKYDLIVNIFDDRTSEERTKIPVQNTTNARAIKEAFEDLAPYIVTDVGLNFKNVKDYPALESIIKDNTVKLKDAVFHPDVDVVDLRPIYSYLQSNLGDVVPTVRRDESEFTIPLFAFVFSGETLFTYSYKWDHSHPNDPEREALLGIALGDIALVSVNHWYFTRGDAVGQKGKGMGMSSTVIHELGHMVGLMHPHQYDDLGDFSYGVMSYFTWDYQFGQSDKDFIRRAHADQIILKAIETLERAKLELPSKIESSEVNGAIAQVEELLKRAETEYGRMDYTKAIGTAVEANTKASLAFESAKQLPFATVPLEQKIAQLEDNLTRTMNELGAARSELAATKSQVPLYLAAGLGMGLIVAAVVFLVMRGQAGREKESAKTRLYAESLRRCSSCGKDITPSSVYCEHCGARQP